MYFNPRNVFYVRDKDSRATLVDYLAEVMMRFPYLISVIFVANERFCGNPFFPDCTLGVFPLFLRLKREKVID